MSSFRRILVGWDGSTDARQALRVALGLGAQVDAEVVALAVLKARSHAEAADQATEETLESRREVMHEMATQTSHTTVASAARVRYEVIQADDATSAFDTYVREHGFDLVIVGRHGLDRALRPHIGGVSEHQVRQGSCPVMVVGTD